MKRNPYMSAPQVGNGFFAPKTYNANVPESFINDLEMAGQSYQAQYNKKPFLAAHPVLGALGGLLIGGPAGGFMMPLIGKDQMAKNQAAAVQGWQDYQKQALENLGTLNARSSETNLGSTVNQAYKNMGIDSPIGQDTALTPEAFDRIIKGIPYPESPEDIQNNNVQQLQQGLNIGRNFANGAGLGAQQAGGNVPQSLPPLPGFGGTPMDGSAPLTGNVETVSKPYKYYDAETQRKVMDMGLDALKAGVNQSSNLMKTPSEIGKTQAETEFTKGPKTRSEEALAKERNASASLKNRTDPNLRGGGGQDPLSIMQKLQNLNKAQQDNVLNQLKQNGFVGKNGELIAPSETNIGFDLFKGGVTRTHNPQYDQYQNLIRQLNDLQSGGVGYTPVKSGQAGGVGKNQNIKSLGKTITSPSGKQLQLP